MVVYRISRLGGVDEAFWEYYVLPVVRGEQVRLADLMTIGVGLGARLEMYRELWDRLGEAAVREGFKRADGFVVGSTALNLNQLSPRYHTPIRMALKEELAYRDPSTLTPSQLANLHHRDIINIFPIIAPTLTPRLQLHALIKYLTLPLPPPLLEPIYDALLHKQQFSFSRLTEGRMQTLVTKMAEHRWDDRQLVDRVYRAVRQKNVKDESWAVYYNSFKVLGVRW
eukprot:TRINITY_DN35186_c0_g1_i1.p1 TRINITY_DN35186_c0_g1~~TRINITY_DN35186_c0_g1_i1.p1  ORF type:complete len:226 (+),score=32.50 TRINITY_DN35186_c0_g1_i1:2-679(+)